MASSLREKAEELLKKKSSGIASPLSEADRLAFLHELEVHQVELEMQNEQLHHAWTVAEVANDKYSRLYDLAPSGYFTLSCKGEISEVNLTGAKMLGKDRLHLINSMFGFFVSEDTRPSFNLFLKKVIASKSKGTCQVTIDQDDNQSMQVFLSGTIVDNGDQCLVTMVNITELRQAQLELLAAKEETEESRLKFLISESDLKKAQAIAHMGSWKWDVKTGEVIWSDEMFRIFGINKNSYSGPLEAVIEKVVHPDDLHLVLPENAGAFAESKPIEYRIILPDQSIRFISAMAGETIFDESGSPLFLSGIAHDITGRKLAEIELRESESRYRLLAENTTDVIWVLDPATMRFLYVSPSAEQLLGYTPEELLALPFSEILIPAMRETFLQRTRQRVESFLAQPESGVGYRNEVVHLCKDGSLVETEVVNRYYLNKETGRVEIQGASRDISAIKLAERALKESREKLRNDFILQQSILESTEYIIIFALDEIYHYTAFTNYHKETIKKIWGADIAIGMNMLEIISNPDDRQKAKKNFDRALKGEHFVVSEAYGDELLFRTFYDNYYSPVRDAAHNIIGVSVFVIDITERMRAEEKLWVSNEFNKSLLQTIPFGMDVVDESGNILFISENLAKQFSRDVLGEKCWELYRDDKRQCSDCPLFSGINIGETSIHEARGVLGGKTFEIHHTGMMFNGQPAMLEAFLDITERKLAEGEILRLNETLEKRIAERTHQLEASNVELLFHMNELEQISYVSNHDLQEPLRTLIQFTQLLTENYGGRLDEDGNKYIDFISSSASRMRLLVTDLFEYSLLGKESLRSLIDCNEIVREVLNDLDDSIRKTDARISVSELPAVVGYPTEMRLLFQNLITNAIKYQKNGMVPEIDISAESHGNEWLFSIKDNGIGIEKKYYEKIFIIFQRLHNRNDFHGTGIGLAHCKKIVEIHGGRIWVESTPGEGSVFMFTIPKQSRV